MKSTKTASQSLDGFTFDLQRFDSAFSGGSGTESDPYKISNANDLKRLANDVNGGTYYSGKYFKLTGDIDLSDVYIHEPIGSLKEGLFRDTINSFKGTFDGDGYTISGLTFERPNVSNLGLFAYLGEGGTIKNLTIANFNITGNSYVGALVGKNYGGTIENCTVSGTISGRTNDKGETSSAVGGIVGYNYSGTVRGSTFSGTVNGNLNIGGLVGRNGGTVKDCTFNNGTVNGTEGVSGIVGANDEGNTVTDCTVNGDNVTINGTLSVGGVVGYNNGTVQNCSASNVEFSGTDYVGGLVGYNLSGTVSGNTVSNVNVSATGEESEAGGLVGRNDDGTVSGNCIVNVSVGGSYAGSIVGYNYEGGEVIDNFYRCDIKNVVAVEDDEEGAYHERNELLYEITLPGGVTASGAKLLLDNKAYAPWGAMLTLSAKTGYIYSDKTTPSMGDEIIGGNATLDPANHYAFKDGDGYTFATADNVASNNYPDLVQVYELTLPEGVSIASGIFAVDGTTTYAVGKITLAAKPGYKISGDLNLNVTGAATVTVTSTSYWGVTDGADGSADNPFLISTIEDLKYLAEYVNDGNDCAGLNFKLADDINLSDVSLTPIGNASKSFSGKFDGDGKIISNLTVNGSNYIGLFGNVGTGGTVQNVTLINATVNGSGNVGALVGFNGGTVTGNKIHGNKDAVGKNSGTVSDNARYYKLTMPDGVTITNANTITDGETTYCASGSTFKLTVNMNNYHKIRSVNNTFANSDGTFTVTMGKGDTNVTIIGYPKIGNINFDSATDTYTIATRDDLKALADYVNGGGDTTDLNFKLAADIGGGDFNIGTESNRFKGTLDGDGHTITVNYDTAADNCALFNYVDGATIQKLTVDGTINTSAKLAAGIVSCVYGTTKITDCRSSVTIDSTVSGDGTHGGLVGLVESGGTINLTDSIFDGKLLGASTTNCGGIVGWKNINGELNIKNCLFVPQKVTISAKNSATFARNGVTNINGGYYMQTFGDAQGTQVYTEPVMPDGVTAKLQSGYSVTFNGTTYYKSGAPVTLTVAAYPDGKYLAGATLNDDATYSCTIDDVASVAWTDLPTIDGLTFDTSIGAYNISTAAELKALATYVNAGNDTSGLNFRLTADINFNGVSWKPIGDRSKQFNGTFNGGGHTISNLAINLKDNSYIGLFGRNGGTIKNVALTKVNINGNTFVGGLVGYNNGGTVQNCSVSGTISGRYLVGGLVAANDFGTIDNCKISGTVNCTDHHGGGLVGTNHNGSVTNCTAGVTVNGTQFVGVLVGYNGYGGKVNDNKYYIAPNSSIAVVNNNDATAANNTHVYKITLPNGMAIAGDNLVLVDYNTAYGTNGIVTLSLKTGCVLNSGGKMSASVFNGDLDLNKLFTVTDYWGVADGADGSADNPYIISDVAGLQYLANYVSGGNDTSGLNFKLAADLNLSSVDNWTTLIGTDDDHQFKGTFDGDGHTIKNLAINLTDNNYIGLFGYIGGDATIQNVVLENISVRGQNEVGGLVGYNDGGTVKDITLKNIFVYGKTWSGGIVGYNDGGTISDCTVTDGQIVGTNSYVGGDGNYIGGIVGYNKSAVTNCSASGTISSTSETSSAVGGLVGYNQGGTVKDGSFSNVEVSGKNEVGGLVGYNSGSGTVTGNKFSSNADAVGENYGTVENNTRYNELTLPEGVTVSGDIITIGDLEEDTSTIVKGSSEVLHLGDYTLTITAVDDVALNIELTDNGLSIVPNQGGGAFNVTLSRGDKEIISGELECISGKINFGYDKSITLAKDTSVNLKQGDYSLTVTTTDEATINIDFTAEGILITPNTGDGTLNLTLSSADGSMNANVEVVSGSFTFGNDGAITVAKDTELQIDFGGGYIVNFKATDAAGGKISLGADGITFAPNSDDGGLQISVTRDGETRSASLDVTGSVTYKLDGSISLKQGTVVRNVFDSGNVLTITANSDADSSIIFAPQTGLTITPATPDALNVRLTNGDLEAVNISSIDGTINYTGGVVTVSDGTKVFVTDHEGYYTALSTEGGTTSVQFGTERAIYTVNDEATLILDYLEGTTWNLSDGTLTDIYNGAAILSEGATFTTNDYEVAFTLEKTGNYNVNGMNVKTSSAAEVLLTNYDTITANGISFHSTDENFVLELSDTAATFKGSTADVKLNGMNNALTVDATDGEFSFDEKTKKFFIAAGTKISLVRDGQTISLTAIEDISAPCKVEEDIFYFDVGDAALNVSVASDGQIVRSGELKLGGVISYSPKTGTFGLTGANSSHGNGSNSSLQFTNESGYGLKFATHDTTVVFIPKISNGKIEVNFPNERKHEMLFTLSHDGQTTFEGQVIISGTIGFELATQELSLSKGTVLTLIGDDDSTLEITALDDAGGQVTFTDDGIKFAPNAGDGQLEMNFVSVKRKANIDISAGAIVLGSDGKFSLEKGTVVNIEWEDGVKLKMTASADGGSIGFDQQGLKISGNGELSIDLTAGDLQTTLSNLRGTIHYNAGKVLFDEDSKITATSTLGGQPVNLTLESFGEGGYIEPSANGTNYVAGTGALQITWSRDGKESTFAVSNGNIYIGHGIFQIAEGSELSTDLKDLVPALYFTTTDAGEYTINGQTITTFAANMAMTATDNRMTFTPGENVVGYDGMTFTGDGTVSLTPDGVILGAGVSVADFDPDNSIVLTETGTVTVDGKTFELTEDVPTGVSVTGAQDGFVIGSDSYGTEQVFVIGDDTYSVRLDGFGMDALVGIASDTTVDANATIDGKESGTYFDIITEEEGKFTIGEKPYTISGDSSVNIWASFDTVKDYAFGFDSLNGTVSGDFAGEEIFINYSNSESGGKYILVQNDDDISIAVNANGLEIFNVSDGASIQALGGASKVNGTGIKVEGNFDYVSASDEILFVHGAENVTLETDSPEKVWVQMTGESMTLNGNELTLADDRDGIWFSNKEIVGLDDGASLTVGEAGTYSTEVVELEAQAGDVIVGLGGEDAYIYDENNPLITKQSTTEELVARFNPDETFVVGSESRGKFDITLNGGDLAVVEDTAAFVNITAGDDTIVSKGQHVNINATDETHLVITGGKATVNGTPAGFGTNYTDIATAIDRGSIVLGDGKITLGSAKVDMGGNDLINFYNRDGELQKVGYVAESDALDASDTDDDLLLFAENYSTVNSGDGDDTIFAGAGTVIDAGDGDNYIELATDDERYERDKGAVVDINEGDNTIENFKAGFDYESDAVAVETSGLSCFFDGTDITVKTADGDTTVLEDVADGEDFAQFKVVDGTTYNVAIAQEGEFIDVTDDKTDVYIGENSGVDFSGYSGQVLIDLDDKRGTIGKTSAQFFGINQLIGGDGITTLIGSDGDETITAGTGRASIWGNWGNDLLIGNTSDDKKAGTEFFMFADDGHDTIDHFEFLTAQNSLTADRIYVGTSDINSATLNGDDVVINFDGSSDLTLIDAAGKNIQISDMIAKVDTDVEFDGIANTYIATDSNAELTVADSLTSAEIWLNNSRDAKFYGDIRTIDASNVSGKTTLAGNALDNTIIGGDGFNTFNYMLGGGNDLIRGTNDGDVINLGVTLDEISSAEILTDSAQIKFTDGGSLTVDGISDVTYQLADGSKFSADHTQREWTSK